MTDQRIKEILEEHKDTLYSINGDWVSALEYDDALKALQQLRDEMQLEVDTFKDAMLERNDAYNRLRDESLKENVRLYELIKKAYDDYHTASFTQFKQQNNL